MASDAVGRIGYSAYPWHCSMRQPPMPAMPVMPTIALRCYGMTKPVAGGLAGGWMKGWVKGWQMSVPPRKLSETTAGGTTGCHPGTRPSVFVVYGIRIQEIQSVRI